LDHSSAGCDPSAHNRDPVRGQRHQLRPSLAQLVHQRPDLIPRRRGHSAGRYRTGPVAAGVTTRRTTMGRGRPAYQLDPVQPPLQRRHEKEAVILEGVSSVFERRCPVRSGGLLTFRRLTGRHDGRLATPAHGPLGGLGEC
jgi:hypothetical protein